MGLRIAYWIRFAALPALLLSSCLNLLERWTKESQGNLAYKTIKQFEQFDMSNGFWRVQLNHAALLAKKNLACFA